MLSFCVGLDIANIRLCLLLSNKERQEIYRKALRKYFAYRLRFEG